MPRMAVFADIYYLNASAPPNSSMISIAPIHGNNIVKIYETIKSGIENTEQTILANELAALINSRMKHLPDKRRTTYHLSLYDGLSVSEIAERLHISYRTAECHLFLARKDMRHFITYFWAC